MKLYQYWVKASGQIDLRGQQQPITCYGGSNQSHSHARARAAEKIAAIQRKIDGHHNAFEGYEAEIREQIIQQIDRQNIVSRNRYGALVLNSENLLFIDIDQPRYSLLDTLLDRSGRAWKKSKILQLVDKKVTKPTYRGLAFRIYETHSGVRVLVTGKPFEARSKATQKMMRDFNADRLYTTLCQKQNCFRARLTPKPYRMRCKAHKVAYPRTPDQDHDLQVWLQTYEQECQAYGTCRLVKTIGHELRNQAIEYHDTLTKARQPIELA